MNKQSLNKVILIGRVGKDPEQNKTQGGMSIAKFSIATTDTRKVDGQYQDETEWHNCVAFGKQAEYIATYIFKGCLVCVEGKMKTSSWESNGQKHYKTDIMVESLVMLNKAVQGTNSQKPTRTYPEQEKVPSASNPTTKVLNTMGGEVVEQEPDLPF